MAAALARELKFVRTPNATWSLPCARTSCPFIDRSRGYSQNGEDFDVRDTFFCDVCDNTDWIRLGRGQRWAQSIRRNQERTYVEIGALDGRIYSNTLMLQRHLNFGGALIEGQPLNAARLKMSRGDRGFFQRGKRSRNHVFGEAVCHKDGFVTYVGGELGGTAGILEFMEPAYIERYRHRFMHATNYTVRCRPIGQMLRSAGLKHVDFFSLNVEGAEATVLETMDWSISVGVWLVEMSHDRTNGAGAAKNRKVIKLLAEHGYRWLRRPGLFVPTAAYAHLKARTSYCTACIARGVDAEIARLAEFASRFD